MPRKRIHGSPSEAARAAEARLRGAGGARKVLMLDAAALDGLAALKADMGVRSDAAVVSRLIAQAYAVLKGRKP